MVGVDWGTQQSLKIRRITSFGTNSRKEICSSSLGVIGLECLRLLYKKRLGVWIRGGGKLEREEEGGEDEEEGGVELGTGTFAAGIGMFGGTGTG